MRSLRSLFVLIPVLCTASAGAAVLHTAPAVAGYADAKIMCIVRNVSSAPRTVTMKFLDFAGASVYSNTVTMEPGSIEFAGIESGAAASCSFTVAGSAKYIRAHALYLGHEGSGTTLAMPAE